MDMERLAAKQKRIMDWEVARRSENVPPRVAQLLGDSIKAMRNLLARCWEEGKISQQDARAIDDLEAKIDQLHEESRLIARNGCWS